MLHNALVLEKTGSAGVFVLLTPHCNKTFPLVLGLLFLLLPITPIRSHRRGDFRGRRWNELQGLT